MAVIRLTVVKEECAKDVGTKEKPNVQAFVRTGVRTVSALVGSGESKDIVLPEVDDKVANADYLSGALWLEYNPEGGWSNVEPDSETAIRICGKVRDGAIESIEEMARGKMPLPVSGDTIGKDVKKAEEDILPSGAVECVLNLRLVDRTEDNHNLWAISRKTEKEDTDNAQAKADAKSRKRRKKRLRETIHKRR